jgi:hypothetical protein
MFVAGEAPARQPVAPRMHAPDRECQAPKQVVARKEKHEVIDYLGFVGIEK